MNSSRYARIKHMLFGGTTSLARAPVNNNIDGYMDDNDDDIESFATAATFDCASESGSETDLLLKSSPVTYDSMHREALQRFDSFQSTRLEVPHVSTSRGPRLANLFSFESQPIVSGYSEWLETLLPMLKWLKTYDWRSSLAHDVVAGCSVGVMVIPQSLSYSKLAGLPVEYGLYSTIVPIYAYACFGSSRQLAVGPVALVSLLLSSGLTAFLNDRGITPSNTATYQDIYNMLAIQTSFLVGLTYIVMGLLRFGFVTNFLSHAVVSGFTTGAAVIIGLSQLIYIVGYNIPQSEIIQVIFRNLWYGLYQFNSKTFMVGTSSLVILIVMKEIGKVYPSMKIIRALGPLTVTVIGVAAEVCFDLSSKGVPVVGKIPKTMPRLTIGEWTPVKDFQEIFWVVLSIAIVGFMESVAIAKKLASQHKYELDSSSELVGLGMANFVGAMFQSYPITGSFSRSAVNNEAGAQSGISGIVTATIVLTVLLFLTPVFEKVPLPILGAIVISGVLGLVDFGEARYLWRVHKFDFFVWLTAALGTMFLGVKIGLAISVIFSLLLVVYEAAYPHTAELGRLPGTMFYRCVKQYPLAETFEGIVMVRIDAPIFFANAQHVRDELEKYELMAETKLKESGSSSSLKYIIMELSPVSHVDSTGLHLLYDVIVTLRERGIQMCFSNPNVKVMASFDRSGLSEILGREFIFVTIHDAVTWCLHEMDCADLSMMSNSSLSTISENREYGSSVRAWRLWHGAKRRGWGSSHQLVAM